MQTSAPLSASAMPPVRCSALVMLQYFHLSTPLVLDGFDVAAALVQDALAVDHPALRRVGAVGEDQAADGDVGGAASR